MNESRFVTLSRNTTASHQFNTSSIQLYLASFTAISLTLPSLPYTNPCYHYLPPLNTLPPPNPSLVLHFHTSAFHFLHPFLASTPAHFPSSLLAATLYSHIINPITFSCTSMHTFLVPVLHTQNNHPHRLFSSTSTHFSLS